MEFIEFSESDIEIYDVVLAALAKTVDGQEK